jgi:hypothetical protein
LVAELAGFLSAWSAVMVGSGRVIRQANESIVRRERVSSNCRLPTETPYGRSHTIA